MQHADADLLAQVVEVSADAICTEDADGRVTSWNAAAERLYGRSAAEMLGAPADLVTPALGAAELRRARERARAGERVERFDTVQQRVDGTPVPVSLTVSPLRGADGAVVGVATSVQDITERVRLAEELAYAHADLQRSQEVLLRSNRDLEQFAYVASHDLSEPLRVVTGYVQLLERRYGEALDERGRRYVEHVVDGCARMRQLIDDLLHWSRFVRLEPALQEVDTGASVRAALRALSVALEESGAVVEVDEPLLAVRADPASLAQLVQNLAGNAVKFRREGQAPHVRVSTASDGADVVLAVDDDGIGVDPRFREKVFRMFQRLHVREAHGGTGIGLAVVQRVAEQSGGSAWV
ncbi:MAG TPA: PAS domain S-box protein, partial [Mycobacteriales bacterium]|nr:PAS domain S-box protein [Mycobacteriales bacterium]